MWKGPGMISEEEYCRAVVSFLSTLETDSEGPVVALGLGCSSA